MADGSVIIDTLLKTDGLNKGVGDLQGKLAGLGSKLTSIGTGMTLGLTAPILAAGAASVKTYQNFDDSMRRVAATAGIAADSTSKDFVAMKNKAKELGASTRFSASEVADGMNYMAMAGWDATKTLAGIEPVLNLAIASGESLATTSDIVTDAMTAFGLSADQAGTFSDILAAASSNANTNVSLLGETFKYAAPVAGALGYTAKDTAIAIGLMANSGIKGSQAGTALKAGLVNLAKPTKKMRDTMNELGISITDSEGNMKSFREVMSDLRTNMSGLSKDEQAAAAATIFGKEAMSGWLSIINASEEDFNKLTNAIDNSEGATQQMVDTIDGGLGGSFASFQSALEGVGIAFGETLAPSVKNLTDKITGFLQSLANLSPETIKLITIIAGVVAAIGPMLLIIGTVVIKIAKFREGVGLLANGIKGLSAVFSFLTSPIGLVVVAILGLIALFVYLWNTNEEFRTKVIEIWTAIQAFLTPIIEAIVTFIRDLWSGLVTWWQENQQGFFDKASEIWQGIVNFVLPIAQAIYDFVVEIFGILASWWQENQDSIKSVTQSTWDLIKTIFSLAIAIIQVSVGIFLGVLQSTWSVAFNVLKVTTQVAWVFISNIFKGTLNSILAIVTFVINQIKAIFEFGMNLIKSVTQIALSAMKGDWSGVLAGIKGLISAFANYGKQTFSNMMNLVKSVVKAGIDTVRNIFNSLWNIDLSGAGQAIMNGFLNGLKSAWSAVQNFVGGIASWIKAHKGPIAYDRRLLIPAGSAIMGGFGKSLKKGFEPIKKNVSGMAGELSDAVSSNIAVNSGFIPEKFMRKMDSLKRYAQAQLGGMDFAPQLAMQPTVVVNITNEGDADIIRQKVNAKNAQEAIINKIFKR